MGHGCIGPSEDESNRRQDRTYYLECVLAALRYSYAQVMKILSLSATVEDSAPLHGGYGYISFEVVEAPFNAFT